jgi:large repetitive protein
VRLVRLLLLAAALSAFAAALAPEAGAVRFADAPCPESGPGGIRVCPDGSVGQAYALRLSGDGGCGPALPYQFRILNGELPPGVSLSNDGELRGTPTSGGTWDFWIELSDQDPPSASWCFPKKSEREFRIRIGAPAATVGTPYSFALRPAGEGFGTWSLVAGVLPQGLALDPATGVLAGTPEGPGSYPLAFSATDSTGHLARVDFALTVYPHLALATARLAPVRRGRFFRAKVRTEGAVGSVVFRVVAGRFPIGVRLDGKAGAIRGTPRKAGTYRVTIQVLDSLGRVATGSLTLTVR